MFNQLDYTMIVVSDMQRSVEFYRDKLGIPLKFQSPDWTEFATGTTTLALHGGGVPSTQPPAGDPHERIEPVDRRRDLRDGLRSPIAALDVRELVDEGAGTIERKHGDDSGHPGEPRRPHEHRGKQRRIAEQRRAEHGRRGSAGEVRAQ